jgi:hypothetical protein
MSFKAQLDRPQLPRNGKVALSEYPKGRFLGIAMRTDRYRYVEWTDKSGKLAARELYDDQTDPQENENIAGDPQYAPLMAELSRQMRASMKITAQRQPERPMALLSPWQPLSRAFYQEADY